MPLREDVKEPPAGEGEAKPKDRKPPASSADEPWKTNPDGTRVRQGRKLPYEKQLHQLFREAAGAVTLVDSFSGRAIELRAEELAYGYARLAQENDAVKAFFERIVGVSAFSAIVGPTVCVVIPILWHFGFVPGKVGAPVTFMSGLPLVTREQEQAYKRDQAKEQEAAARAAAATHPHGEAPNSDGNGDGDES